MSIKMSRVPFLLVTSCAVLGLAGCSNPNWLPTGYVYHDEMYKSPNPPESHKFTSAQRATMGPEQADQFRMAVYQLSESLTMRAGLPPKAVYVAKPEPMTPFYANMDNDLRESLRHLGYRLSDSPVDAYVFTYEAKIVPQNNSVTTAEGTPNTHIALRVFDGTGQGSKMLTIEEGDFYIKGADKLNVPFASFPGVVIPEPTGPGTFNR